MTKESFNKLKEGDIVQNKLSGNFYTVFKNNILEGDIGIVVAVKTITIMDPERWDVAQRGMPTRKKP